VRYTAVATMAAEGFPVQVTAGRRGRRVRVAESGNYAWRIPPPSARAVRHAGLTDLIRQIHAASSGVYGGRRVYAELTLGAVGSWLGTAPWSC
jgi:hypothetical protein